MALKLAGNPDELGNLTWELALLEGVGKLAPDLSEAIEVLGIFQTDRGDGLPGVGSGTQLRNGEDGDQKGHETGSGKPVHRPFSGGGRFHLFVIFDLFCKLLANLFPESVRTDRGVVAAAWTNPAHEQSLGTDFMPLSFRKETAQELELIRRDIVVDITLDQVSALIIEVVCIRIIG